MNTSGGTNVNRPAPKFVVSEIVDIATSGRSDAIAIAATEILSLEYVRGMKMRGMETGKIYHYTGYLYRVDKAIYEIPEQVIRKRPDLHERYDLTELARKLEVN
jgi:hypothetical protein